MLIVVVKPPDADDVTEDADNGDLLLLNIPASKIRCARFRVRDAKLLLSFN